MKRIACVACLDPKFSVHAHTFLRAVVLARHGQLVKEAQIRLFDDGGSREGALRAAREIAAWGADAVVGHYVSSAAAAAAPEYARRGVPLFLPAATASHLTRNETTWRLCDNDADYVAWLKERVSQAQWQVATPEHDGSLHGISVSEQLAAALPITPYGPTRIFTGRYAASVRYAIRWAHIELPGRLILTDDAGSPALVPDLLAHGIDPNQHEILIAGISPHPVGEIAHLVRQTWQRRWGGEPGAYLWETLAAIQTAAAFPHIPAQTVLGPLRFDARRESRPGHFRLWQVTRQGFIAYQPVPETI
ncbi:ABC transporter substrate-binding protein [Cronobacter sakazakii]|uniref:ABC transporter substrate-binding protein n=1 Tax=Cronobacter sakazakii TaxID=28141 RepID=UPI000976D98C|nr:ABC transporter substrate-binding protein [Cronobacter sakazakii]EGT4277414.1 amino acid ABC transporter substrate-binding protein [Cronobacter sakazakii]EGT5695540.1 amino acid ABC transporter substrate-binding protein [Cronobacter sakazakii]EGT5704389.1 amino acid ABC transporter substrate-binding protein [Cronobacter sakazakii]EGT5720625.1 amino acid ABC transporter substrate-binding protein [Cronobacter sakazakii]EJG0682529.1 ABC transporter substrate-binding protein [Cronobacter sakaza